MIERMVRGIGGKGFYNNFNPSSYCLRTPVDFVEKRVAYSICTGELSSAAPRRLEGILFTFHNAVTFTLRHLCEAEGIHGWDVGMHGLGA